MPGVCKYTITLYLWQPMPADTPGPLYGSRKYGCTLVAVKPVDDANTLPGTLATTLCPIGPMAPASSSTMTTEYRLVATADGNIMVGNDDVLPDVVTLCAISVPQPATIGALPATGNATLTKAGEPQ